VLALVLGQGMAVAAAGGAIGLACAFILTRSLRSLLYGVRDTDPITFAAVALVLTSTAFAATYFPARRAARTDPMVSLRTE
jgi:putative ABC transport system permease protein